MDLNKLILNKNECFKAGVKIKPEGIMVHSTGVNNPNLKRYVGPDDGRLGENHYKNYWNQARPDGREVCVHAFIGKLGNGKIATYQTLPWDHRAWHAGGRANDTHIGFEICEDEDPAHFHGAYKEALELCAYLCRKFYLTEKDVIGHSEGYNLGIASNHADPEHWFKRYGKSMDSFREDLKVLLSGEKLYRVQVGAFRSKDNAERLLIKIKRAGFTDAFVKVE